MVDARDSTDAVAQVRFHLHARLFVGPLYLPERNELQSGESDDCEEIMTLAKELVTRGFAVWVYNHDSVAQLPNGEGQYRLIAEWNAHGKQMR